MEFIEGDSLKKMFGTVDQTMRNKLCRAIGRNVGKLHAASIIHGDLTTSNIIYSIKDKSIIFIDFGLGFISDRLEDFGIDIYLLERAFISTHEEIYDECWKVIIEGYKETSPCCEEIEEKIKEIESRGRYSERM